MYKFKRHLSIRRYLTSNPQNQRANGIKPLIKSTGCNPKVQA